MRTPLIQAIPPGTPRVTRTLRIFERKEENLLDPPAEGRNSPRTQSVMAWITAHRVSRDSRDRLTRKGFRFVDITINGGGMVNGSIGHSALLPFFLPDLWPCAP